MNNRQKVKQEQQQERCPKMAIHQSPLNKFFAFERQQQIGLANIRRRSSSSSRGRSQRLSSSKLQGKGTKLKLKEVGNILMN